MLSSGDQRAISERCHVTESDEPRDCGKSTPSLVTFALRHDVGKVTYSVCSTVTRDFEEHNRTILSFDQRIEVLCRLGEAHHVERLLPSQCGKTQMARRPSMLSKQTGKAIVAYVKYKYSRTSSSSFVSFTQCSPTCGRMPLPSLSLWPGRQPCRPRLVGDRRGGGPSSVAPRSRNPPTGHRRDSPISSSLFSHGQPLCAVG